MPASLRLRATQSPDGVAVTFLTDGEDQTVSWTLGQLDGRARAIAAALQHRGVQGERVLVAHPAGLEFIAALYGCWYAGAVAVPTPLPNFRLGSRSGSRFTALTRDCTPRLALISAAQRTNASLLALQDAALQSLDWIATENLDQTPDQPPENVHPNDIALLQYTSGSTGVPRGVVLTHANVADNQRAIHEKFGTWTGSLSVSWLPPYHDMGLNGGILQPLTVGFPVVLMDPAHFMSRPVRWLNAVSRYRASISGGPNFAYDLCVRAFGQKAPADMDLSCWTLAYSGAEPVRAETLDAFARAFKPQGFSRRSFYPCYGLAEATLIVTGGDREAEPVIDRPAGSAGIVGCGNATDRQVVLVMNEAGGQCDPGAVGEVWVAGPSVAQGYWQQAEESAQTFGHPVPGHPGLPFLRTGDLGYLKGNELFITGRLKDLIIVRGRNLHPQDIEVCASESHPALAAAAAFPIEHAGAEAVVLACEVDRSQRHNLDVQAAMRTVIEAVAKEFDIHLHAVVLLKPGALARTTSGKIARRICRDAFDADAWEPLALLCPSRNAPELRESDVAAPLGQDKNTHRAWLLARLRVRAASALGLPETSIDEHRSLVELGIDSLLRVEMLLRLESDLGFAIDEDAIGAQATLAEIADSILATPQPLQAGPSGRAAPSPDGVPFTPLQAECLRPGIEHVEKFYGAVFLRLPLDVDISWLRQAVDVLVLENAALRLRFQESAGSWTQRLGDSQAAVGFRRIDLAGADGDRVRATMAELRQTAHTGFNLVQGPLLQLVWLDRGAAERGAMMIAIHHLVSDGVSFAVLLSGLERHYGALAEGKPPAARGGEMGGAMHGKMRGAVSFEDWARRQHAFAQSAAARGDLAYWKASCGLAGPVAVHAPPPGAATSMKSVWGQLTRAQDRAFQARFTSSTAQHHAFLAVLAHAWSHQAACRRVFVRLENHGRFALNGPAPLKTVGWLACRYPVAFDVDPASSMEHLLASVAATVAAVPHHGLSYGALEWLSDDPAVRSAMAALARPVISMSYRSRLDDPFRNDARFPALGLHFVTATRTHDERRPTLALEAGRRGGNTWWQLSYDPAHYETAQIAALEAQIGQCLLQLLPAASAEQ